MSPGLIHPHFKDKEALWNLVGARITEEFAESGKASIDPALKGTPEGLRKMLEAYMRYWREHSHALRVQLWRVLGAPEEERKTRSRMPWRSPGRRR